MRIAVVSDIHGNLAALEAVVADFSKRPIDLIVNLGDNLSGPLLPRETANFLMAQHWIHLAGNHERQLLSSNPADRYASDSYALSQLGPTELDWIATLQPRKELSAEVLLCHGTPASDVHYFLETVTSSGIRPANAQEIDERLGDDSHQLVLCGHTHVPRAVRTSRGTLIVNPGSVGLPAYDDMHPYPHKVETGSPDARYAIVEKIASGWTAQLISVPYDHHAMADLARQRERLDWEHALRYGYMPR